MALFVNFRSVVHALSDSLDLVGINDVHHGKRVGIIAVEIAGTSGNSYGSFLVPGDVFVIHSGFGSATDWVKRFGSVG